jgi:hypothetical protein
MFSSDNPANVLDIFTRSAAGKRCMSDSLLQDEGDLHHQLNSVRDGHN